MERNMARFYIHLRHGDQIERDTEGEDFADLPAARSEALRCAREILADAIRSAQNDLPLECFIIADVKGRELATISLKEVLPKDLC
jgi:hypothetical protein